jgi:hypothetical protein
MRKWRFLIKAFSVFFYIVSKCSGLTIQVSSQYVDAPQSNNQNTLEGAYERLLFLYPSKIVGEAIDIQILNDVYVNALSKNTLMWDISGTSAFPIFIHSGIAGYPKLMRSVSDVNKNYYLIEIRSVAYVSISNLCFPEATVGVFINSSDYCKINGCQFYGNSINYVGGGASISVSRYPTTLNLPTNNTIFNNFILSKGASSVVGYNGMRPGYSYYHGVYLAQCNQTAVFNNTIINPAGDGIHYWHSYSQNNIVKNNIIDICEDPNEIKVGLLLGYEPAEGPASTVYKNINSENYINFYKGVIAGKGTYTSIDTSRSVLVNNDLVALNPDFKNNYTSRAYLAGNKFTIDPYWIQYNPSTVTNRIVSGDFDGDGFSDDMAALNVNGTTSKMNVWLNKRSSKTDTVTHITSLEQDKAFEYNSSWWQSSTFKPDQVGGRFTSGDFNGDGKSDIAAMCDLGGGITNIVVWLSDGKSFNIQNSGVSWWLSASNTYYPAKVTGRFISGDFNGDGLSDLAAMYDFGNAQSRIHVWLSKGNSFLAPATKWTSNVGSYDALKVTNRFVSGDFNGDHLLDIGAMYEYDTAHAALHVWLSDGLVFQPASTPFTFWNTNSTSPFKASAIGNRMLCADMNGDSFSDIIALSDDGQSTSSIKVWTSNGKTFNNFTTYWTSAINSYSAAIVTGRLLVGDFNNDGKKDILGMADYSYNSIFYRSRFHVWENAVNTLQLKNGSLGYPWVEDAALVGLDCTIAPLITNDNNHDKIISELKVYPNPVIAILTIEYSEEEEATVFLYNYIGELLHTQKVYKESKLDLKNQVPGMYFIKLSNSKHTLVQKIIKL